MDNYCPNCKQLLVEFNVVAAWGNSGVDIIHCHKCHHTWLEKDEDEVIIKKDEPTPSIS